MDEKLTPKHLDLLARLGINEKPIKILNIKEIRLFSDLVNFGLAKKEERKEGQYIVPYYEINNNGRDYYNKILQDASEHFENNTNSN